MKLVPSSVYAKRNSELAGRPRVNAFLRTRNWFRVPFCLNGTQNELQPPIICMSVDETDIFKNVMYCPLKLPEM